jgi:hypothetical protein
MKSDHFDGRHFFNPTGPQLQPFSAIVLTFVGHATFLMQTGEGNLLTDPVWAERAGPACALKFKLHGIPQTAMSRRRLRGRVALRNSHRDTLANLSMTGHLRCFSDQPVAEIVQCGEPLPRGLFRTHG